MTRKVLIGMAGAPTVGVDASLHACQQALSRSCEVWAVVGGPDGLVEGRHTRGDASGLVSGPRAGSALGAGRRPLTGRDAERIVERLAAAGVEALVLAGGEGTMALLAAIEEAA